MTRGRDRNPKEWRGKKGNTWVESTSDTHAHNATETMFRLSSRTETLQGEGLGRRGVLTTWSVWLDCMQQIRCEGQSRNVVYIQIQPHSITQLFQFLLLKKGMLLSISVRNTRGSRGAHLPNGPITRPESLKANILRGDVTPPPPHYNVNRITQSNIRVH